MAQLICGRTCIDTYYETVSSTLISLPLLFFALRPGIINGNNAVSNMLYAHTIDVIFIALSRFIFNKILQSRIVLVPIWHVPKWLCSEASGTRWTCGDSSRVTMSTLVAKVYFHFKVSNVSKVANLYGIVLFPCMWFIAMYTFAIVTMRLCGQRNSSPK